MNLSIQSPKANAFFNTAAPHTPRSAQTSPSPAAQSSADTFERGAGRGWQTLISNANSTTNRSAGLDSPSLDTPELGPSNNGFGLGFAGFAGMGVSRVDALDPHNKGTAVGSQAASAGEEDGKNRIENRLSNANHYALGCDPEDGYIAAAAGAFTGIVSAGPASATPAGAALAATGGAITGYTLWQIDCALGDQQTDTKVANLEKRLEELEKKLEDSVNDDSCEDPTQDAPPSNTEVESDLDKAAQLKPSDPEQGSVRDITNVDLPRVERQRKNQQINWGPDGEEAPSTGTGSATPSLGPCGPDSPTPNRPE